MAVLKHSFVAKLKKNHPWLASILSRAYAFVVAGKNRRVAQKSEVRPLHEVIFWSVTQGRDIARAALPARLMEGDVIVAKGLLDGLGMAEQVSAIFERGYDLPLSSLSQLHDLFSTQEILEKTEAFKNDPELLAFECTLLKSIFADEPELYAELMPNLRPHLPYDAVRSVEREVERKIGRGKMNAHGPHKDSWRYHPENTINVWLALTPVNNRNGMFLLPDSRDYYPQFADNEIRIGCDTYPKEQYHTDLNAGDAVLFSAELLHGSVLNQTDKTRFAFSMRCTLEPPKFHRSFMYNYVRLKPGFSNLSVEKVMSRSSFEPPSRERHCPRRGGMPQQLDIVEMTTDRLVVSQDEKELVFPRRCPHQQMDLKYGYLEGETLVCPQHQMRVCTLRREKAEAA